MFVQSVQEFDSAYPVGLLVACPPFLQLTYAYTPHRVWSSSSLTVLRQWAHFGLSGWGGVGLAWCSLSFLQGWLCLVNHLALACQGRGGVGFCWRWILFPQGANQPTNQPSRQQILHTTSNQPSYTVLIIRHVRLHGFVFRLFASWHRFSSFLLASGMHVSLQLQQLGSHVTGNTIRIGSQLSDSFLEVASPNYVNVLTPPCPPNTKYFPQRSLTATLDSPRWDGCICCKNCSYNGHSTNFIK